MAFKIVHKSLFEMVSLKTQEANAHYNFNYDNDIYLEATRDLSVEEANLLIDDALALCGNPGFKYSRRNWHPLQVAFLALFCKARKEKP